MTRVRDDGARGAEDGAVAAAADDQVGAGDVLLAGVFVPGGGEPDVGDLPCEARDVLGDARATSDFGW